MNLYTAEDDLAWSIDPSLKNNILHNTTTTHNEITYIYIYIHYLINLMPNFWLNKIKYHAFLGRKNVSLVLAPFKSQASVDSGLLQTLSLSFSLKAVFGV